MINWNRMQGQEQGMVDMIRKDMDSDLCEHWSLSARRISRWRWLWS